MELKKKPKQERKERFEAAFRARMGQVTRAGVMENSTAQLCEAYLVLPMRLKRDFWGPVNAELGYEEDSQMAVKYLHNTFLRGGKKAANRAKQRPSAKEPAAAVGDGSDAPRPTVSAPPASAALQEDDTCFLTPKNASWQSVVKPVAGETGDNQSRELQEVADIFDFSFL